MMKVSWLRAVRKDVLSVLVVVGILCASLVQGSAFAKKDFDQLIAEADQIFLGTVTALDSRKEPTGAIVTEVTFSTARVLKGAETGTMILEVLGGTVGEETMEVGGVPKFEIGVTYLVFAKDNRTAVFPIVGGAQGLYQIRRDETTGKDMILNAYGMPLASDTITAVTQPASSIPQGALPSPAPVSLDTFVQAIQSRLGRP